MVCKNRNHIFHAKFILKLSFVGNTCFALSFICTASFCMYRAWGHDCSCMDYNKCKIASKTPPAMARALSDIVKQ